MPGCVLRIQSKTLKVEILVKASGLQPIVVFRKGEPKTARNTRLRQQSGFNVGVSHEDGLKNQARDAIRFLRRHAAGLTRVRRCRNFGGMTLDFGLYDLATPDRPWPTYHLPPALIELAGKHRIEIELSFYGAVPGGS